MKFLPLLLVLFLFACATPPPGTPAQEEQRAAQPNVPSPAHKYVDYVLVEKSKNRMYLMKQGNVVREYHVSLGKDPVGPKRQQGDLKTPEGKYNLVYKNPKSKFFRSIMLDYPNEQDIRLAQARGVDPGNHIVIHGQPREHFSAYEGVANAFNWTDGCIAVTNPEMIDIWKLVDIDTPIEIRP